MQVSDYTFEDGQLQLRCAEAVVGSVQLRFLDPATNSPKDKTRTKPHIITRHLATKPGQVGNAHAGQWTGPVMLCRSELLRLADLRAVAGSCGGSSTGTQLVPVAEEDVSCLLSPFPHLVRYMSRCTAFRMVCREQRIGPAGDAGLNQGVACPDAQTCHQGLLPPMTRSWCPVPARPGV